MLLMIIGNAFWRGLLCCMTGLLPPGLFTLMFFIGTLVAGQTIETMGRNQSIEWITFNVLNIACGQSLVERWRKRPSYQAGGPRIQSRGATERARGKKSKIGVPRSR